MDYTIYGDAVNDEAQPYGKIKSYNYCNWQTDNWIDGNRKEYQYSYFSDGQLNLDQLYQYQGVFITVPYDTRYMRYSQYDAYGNRCNYLSILPGPMGSADGVAFHEIYSYNNILNYPNKLVNYQKLDNNNVNLYTESNTYDPNGSLTQREITEPSLPNRIEHYAYNYRGLVSEYYKTSALSNTWSYRYSPFGEREQKYVTSLNATTNSKRIFAEYYNLDLSSRQHSVYNGASPKMGDGLQGGIYLWPTEYNIFVGSSANISYKAKNTGDNVYKKYYNFYDHLGSLCYVMSEESKGVDSRNNIYYYGAFGKMNEALSKEKNSRLNYINKEQDLESGLRDHGVRKYDEDIGRFTSVDPLWNKYIGWTPYQYSFNDPIDFKDDNGLWAWVVNAAHPADYQFKESLINSSLIKSSSIENTLNSYATLGNAGNWTDPDNRHYAPNVAQHVRNTELWVGINNFPDGAQGKTGDYLRNQIGIDYEVYKGNKQYGSLEKEFFHEVIHSMGHTEFEVGAALFSAGFISNSQLSGYFAPNKTSNGNKLPDSFKQYFKDGEVIKGKEAEFEKAYYNLGQSITGQSR